MKRKRAFFAIILIILPILVYLPNLGHELIWDSKPIILENDLLKGKFSLPAVFASGYWQTTSQRSDGGYDYYRPLMILSFMAENAAWGLSPWRLRLVNLFLFIASLFILYFFLQRLPAPPGAAEAAILLYALFPLHLDNINWVVGRCDLLMLFFASLALLLFDLFLERRSSCLLGLAVFSYALALLSKESAVFFLPIFPLHQLIRKRRLTLHCCISPLLVTAAYWLLKSSVIGRGGVPIRLFPGFWENVLQPLGALGYYARSLVFPYAYDMFLPIGSVLTLPYIAAGSLLALLIITLPNLASRDGNFGHSLAKGRWGAWRAELAPAWSWTVPFLCGTVLMVFTPIHPFSISTRYLLVPALGWTWFLGHRLAGLRPAARRAVLILMLAASVVTVTIQARSYRNEAGFWSRALHSAPGESFFLYKHAGELLAGGEIMRAEALLNRALAAPMKPSTAAGIALHLADIAFAQARYRESLGWLEKIRALQLDPPQARHRLLRLQMIHRARGDLAAAEAAILVSGAALPAPRRQESLVALYVAFAAWDKARAAVRALPAPQAAEWAGRIAGEESAFQVMGPDRRAGFFLRHGNFLAAWNAFPYPDSVAIAWRLRSIQLALLAGLEEEGRRRIERLAGEQGEDFRILNSIGDIFFALHRAEESLEFYRRSLRLNPGQPALRERVEAIGEQRGLPPSARVARGD